MLCKQFYVNVRVAVNHKIFQEKHVLHIGVYILLFFALVCLD